MAISTYAELQTAVANWLHRAGLTAIVPDLITLGEKRIFREVRVRVMESALNSAIASGVLAVPADYLELKSAYIDGTPVQQLQRATASQIYTQYPLRTSTSKPKKIAREGANFIFGPYPDSDYTVKGIYYAAPTIVSSSDNALFVANPDLYLFAALSEASAFIKNDARIALWEQKYQSVKAMMEASDRREYGAGGGMEIVAA
jgi:hypothetical protein